MMSREEKLLTVRHTVHMTPHIAIDGEKCISCMKPCLYFCPAGCFLAEGDGIKFQYEGCLECGTCRIMCHEEAIEWNYPLGGYGVSIRMG